MEEFLILILSNINDFIWTYAVITLLIVCGLYFTFKTKAVQFRHPIEMVRLLSESTSKGENKKGISSFQAFCVSVASRVGTGNLAGVATAISIGGASAVFWMWVMALMGSASAFVESTLAQVYKKKEKNVFIGGPAYYILLGLKCRWAAVLFAVVISITFGLAFNSVQSNTISQAFSKSYDIQGYVIGIIISLATCVIIFGGIRRIASLSSIIVPIMAILYISITLYILASNISLIPDMIKNIVGEAFGVRQFAGGVLGVGVMQGIRRGLFSNEAGMGSAPNDAASADVTHPVKQGFLQALGVFTDTLIICSCTAFVILISGSVDPSVNGIQLTQDAFTSHLGSLGDDFIAICIFLFAFSSIIGNYYYGETNIKFITGKKKYLQIYRIAVCLMVLIGSIVTLEMAWSLADLTMAIMTIINVLAILLLGKIAFICLSDYNQQKRKGIKNPVFKSETLRSKGIDTSGITEWE